jgi:hypothetical protein
MTEFAVVTFDNKLELIVSAQSNYHRFQIRPFGIPATLANTRNYAFIDEAIIALQLRGYEYAESFVSEAVLELEKRRKS